MTAVIASIAKLISTQFTGHTLRDQILRGSSAGLLAKVLVAGIAFVCQVLLARAMGVTEYGLWVYALTCANVLSIIPKAGFDVSLVRYVAEYSANRQWGKLRGIIECSGRFSLIAGVAIAIVSVSLVYGLSDMLSSPAQYSLWLAFAGLPFMAANSLRSAALRGLKRVFIAELPDALLRPLLLTAIVVMLSTVTTLSAIHALKIQLVLLAVVFAVGGYLLRKSLRWEVKLAVPEYCMREWIIVSAPLMGMAGIQIMMTQVDILMVGTILGTQEAGIYSAGARLADLVVLGLAGLNLIAAPMIAELYHTGKKYELRHMIALVRQGGVVLTVLASLFLVVFGTKLLWLFGGKFVTAYEPMLFLILGQVVNALCGPVGIVATMTGHERAAVLVMAAALMLDLALNVVLIPRFGLVGAACAAAASIAFWNIALLIFTKKCLPIGVELS